MNNHELIQNLSLNLKPVKKFKINKMHLIICISAGFFSFMAGLALVGLRSDFWSALQTPLFLIEAFLLLTLALFSTVTALQLTVPDFSKSRSLPLVFVTITAWLLYAGYKLISEPILPFDNGSRCLSQIILGALIPASFIYLIAIKGASLHRAKLGAAILLSGSAYGALMAEFSCAVCSPLHFLVWHAIPVIGLCLLGLWVGRLLIKKI